MSTSTPKNPENEEIDLGVLFNSIGKGITKFFNAIGSVITFLFNTLLVFAIFVRKRIVFFALAIGAGFIAGVVIEMVSPPTFVAKATLEPHFDSARQLYSNVAYLHVLASQKDSVQLGAFFDIPATDAATISTIEIEPFLTKTRLLQEYNNYVTGLDSLVATEIPYADYVKQIDDFEIEIHILTVKSTKQDIFGSLLNPLTASVSDVTYFKDQQVTQLENLELSDSITQVSITQTDSLLSLFEEVRIVEANKQFSNGTNLYMSDKAENNTEISLLNRKMTLTEELKLIRTAKLKAVNVVDVISPFPEVGYLDVSFWKNRKIQGILAGFIFLSMFYVVMSFDAIITSKVNE
ncbi:MAG: hypothetical protein O2961_05400 [Bacteroidetes bacterium]|nr:hypothetical protein [Bacteroidota bacterium]